MLKRLWLRITNKPAYGALLEMERLKTLIVKKKKNHKKRSHLEKQLYDVRARYEILRKIKMCKEFFHYLKEYNKEL